MISLTFANRSIHRTSLASCCSHAAAIMCQVELSGRRRTEEEVAEKHQLQPTKATPDRVASSHHTPTPQNIPGSLHENEVTRNALILCELLPSAVD